MDKPPFHPLLLLIVGVISISTSAIFVKLAGDAPSSIIAFYRLALAVIIMAPYVFLKHAPDLKHISSKDWVWASVSGIFLALHFILWFESLNYTSVASSVVLVSMQPIFAFIGTFLFFKERFSAGAVLSMIIAITGSVIISWGDFQVSGVALYGDLLAIGGAIMVTGYFLVGQSLRKRLSMTSYTFIVYLVASVTLLGYNLVLQVPFGGYSGNQWLIYVALAIIPTFFGHSLFNWSLRWVSASKISMSILLEPIGAAILAFIILGEGVSWAQWLGGSIVIFGLMLFIISTKKMMKPKLTHHPTDS
ncbi:membrane protein [Halobacillus andaensis]|uniref:Membrane protein n=1 Tax=Halobacillus andaensis TaxID=1176239 RepID=A0A917F1F0_HALAA|nr:EamA family transporter [Halobacillus andaensis]MBP2006200.1 drug/metabolite transporter (DMT)-like permease [Halobacillus andaensis]GGF33231.1 membrane protein [Halobacillus andaensis]